MTVKDLIKKLKTEDPDRIVVLANDGEGNSFSPLSFLARNSYRKENRYHGDVGIEKVTPALKKLGYSEEDVLKGEKALVLWPTN